uniref:Uncharacterized protein n=1 Tax=Canis lupus dingo TaxID=286419 RepID=A0A8C0K7Z5_CANLU
MGPQAGARVAGAPCSRDDYMAMSPGSLCGPLPELPADLEPPPVNRDLKPQRRPRPPPLDLRNLSTIREHASLTRTCTVPCNRTRFLSPERNGINSARFFADSVSREEEESYIQMNHRTANPLGSGALTWTKKFSLDYLALDFNSASPAPVQQKLLLAEEQRVDYVQSTKQEWTDERQSKVRWTAEDPVFFRISVNAFLDQLSLVMRNIRGFGSPPMRSLGRGKRTDT